MRIVFITLFKEGCGGGEGRVAHEMAQYFTTQHDVVLMCPGEKTDLHTNDNGLKIMTVKSAGEGDVYVAALSTKQVNRIFDFLDTFQPDVIHAHETLSICLIGQVWAKMHGVPFIHTAHILPSKILDFGVADAVPLLRHSLGESLARQGFMNFFTNFYENCDAVVALNKFAAQDIRGFGYKGKIVTIPNGRNLDLYNTCAFADLAAEKKLLTFVGYLSERKNQEYLIDMLQYLPANYRLQLIGSALKPSYEDYLKGLANQRQLDVAFLGQVAHHDIPTYLEKTHVLVSASKMEVQSLVIIEAMASGTPVVGLSNETVDELVDDSVGVGLPPDTAPKAFAERVMALCRQQQSTYEALCRNARRRVQRHNWRGVMEETISVYRILQQEAPPTPQNTQRRLTKTLSFIPPGEVRDYLTEKMATLEQTLQRRDKPKAPTNLVTKLRKLKRVPKSTWLILALTIPLSMLLYQGAKLLAALSRRGKSGDGDFPEITYPKWLRRKESVDGTGA